MEELLFGWIFKPAWALTTIEEITIFCELSIIIGLLYIMRCMITMLRRNKKKEERKRYKYFNQARKRGKKRNENKEERY